MKIGIYDPYLDTLGGGEKYILDIATFYASEHEVTLFWKPEDKEKIQNLASQRFQLDIKNIAFASVNFTSASIVEKYQKTSPYDMLIFVSDGSIPFLFAKKNYLIIQHPIEWVSLNFIDGMKLLSIKKVICYSHFVKKHLDKTLNVNSLVIPPAVESVLRPTVEKSNMILSVGRFTQHMNAKKQDVMIDAFRSLSSEIPGWELILAGGLKDEDKEYFATLQEKSKGLPIRLLPNIARAELSDLYNRASIYWHATGYGEDIQKHPERTEHFGITTIEAMSAGCIPVVFNGGGQAEIIQNNVNGFTWKEISELQSISKDIATQPHHYAEIRSKAIDSASEYSEDIFHKNLMTLLQ